MTSENDLFPGTILKIVAGDAVSDLVISIGNAIVISAQISNSSVKQLALVPGTSICIFIKKSPITFATDEIIIMVQNTDSHCIYGTVNDYMQMDIGGDRMLTAIITNDSTTESIYADCNSYSFG